MGLGWQEASPRVIIIGNTPNQMWEERDAQDSLDLFELLRKRGMDGYVNFLREPRRY